MPPPPSGAAATRAFLWRRESVAAFESIGLRHTIHRLDALILWHHKHSQNGPQHTHTLLTLSRLHLENQISASKLELQFNPTWHISALGSRPKLSCVCSARPSPPLPPQLARPATQLSAAPPLHAARPVLHLCSASACRQNKREERARDRRLARRPRDRPRDRAQITTSSCDVTRSKAGSLCGRRRRGRRR